MAKLMTSEEIESGLIDVCEQACSGEIDGVGMRVARAAFELGKTHGQSVMLERATSLMAANVASVQEAQMGRSLLTILGWVAARRGRQFSGVAANHASVLLADGEEEDNFHFHFEHADSPTEALSKLATWCNEHSIAHPVRDTEPSPAAPQLSADEP
jgi:hypothetical protein